MPCSFSLCMLVKLIEALLIWCNVTRGTLARSSVFCMGHHHMQNTIALQRWSVETSKTELSRHCKVARLITSKVPLFHSPKTTNKETSLKYQLHMEEAKMGDLFYSK